MNRSSRSIITTAARAAGASPDRIAVALAVLEEKEAPSAATQPLAVRQARVCELLDCSRFHVRKLVREGRLPQRDLAGLKRYALADVLKLVGG
jgi:hypothetical protein